MNVDSKIIRVLFADDHKEMRQGLIGVVTGQPCIQVVGEAVNGEEAIALARLLRPDVIIMDVSMPVLGGVEATRRITLEMPDVRVIGMSMSDDAVVIGMMREAGADGFIGKGESCSELLKAIYESAGSYSDNLERNRI